MKNPLLFICFFPVSMACSPPITRADAVQQVQEGITGYIYEESGNRMPMKGAPPQTAKGLSTNIYIYELTNTGQVSRVGATPFYTTIRTRLVATAHSDSTGAFAIRLAPGRYSLFIKWGDRFYANSFDTANNIAPVTVQKGRLSPVRVMVSASAVY